MVERLVRLAQGVAGRPRATLLVAALLTAAFAAVAAARLRVDNEIDAWLPRGDASLELYREFRATFGPDAFFVVGCDGVDADDPAGSRALAALQGDLAGLPGVDRVLGPFADDQATPSEAAPFLIASDRRAAAWFVHPRAGLERGAREALFAAIEDLRAQAPGALHVAGPEAINHYLDVGSRRSFGGLFPVVAAVVALVLLLALRDLRVVVAVMLLAGMSTAWTLGALALAGRPMNMVVSSLPALLLVLGTVTSLHVLDARARRLATCSDAQAWRAALAETLRPCLFTAATTAVGLAALALAPLPPLRDLGLFGALGVLVNFALVFLVLPGLATCLGTGRGSRAHGRIPFEGAEQAEWAGAPALARFVRTPRWRAAILASAAGVLLLGSVGVARLRVESDILSFFPSSHPLLAATHTLEERILGLTPIEIWFSGPAAQVFAPAAIAGAAVLADGVRAEPDVTGLFGPTSPTDSPATWPGHLRLHDGRADVRWTVAARTTSIEESDRLVRRIEDEVAAAAPAGVDARVTGSMPILIRMQALLLVSTVRSFGASIGLVTALLAVAFRSVGVGLLSLVPNVLPVFATLGAMGFLGVPLDVATVTVASIALGLVVDDTIHFLEHYVRAGRTAEAVETALGHVGRPILFSSLAVAAGFSAFAAAPFRPTFHFGVLVAVTSLFALVCDLLVLPALLSTRPRCS